MSSARKELVIAQPTTLSYIVLGLLAIRPMSAYELVQGYNRSLGMIISRSEAAIYNEPKKLSKDGLVTSHDEQRGRRAVAIYEITDAGTAVLVDWRRTEPAFPLIDAEPVLRLVFADLDEPGELREAIGVFRDQTIERAAFQLSTAQEYLAAEGPFQDRQPVVALGGLFVARLFTTYLQWCDEVLEALDTWEEGGSARDQWGAAGIARLATVLEQALAETGDR